jgi:TPR repeat protein
MLSDGEGGEADLARGLELFETACGGGDALGCFRAGRLYHFGFKNVPRDKARAKHYFDRACKQSKAMCGRDPNDL